MRHRPTLTQRHKSFKGTKKHKHRQKESNNDHVTHIQASIQCKAKHERLQHARQIRKNKIGSAKGRSFAMSGGSCIKSTIPPPPKNVVLVPFHENVNVAELKRSLIEFIKQQFKTENDMQIDQFGTSSDTNLVYQPVTIPLPTIAASRHTASITILESPPHLHGCLDALKCADVAIAVMGVKATADCPAFSENGYRMLSAIKLQGMPTFIGVVAPKRSEGRNDGDCSMAIPPMQKNSTSAKKQTAEENRFAQRYFMSEFGCDKKCFVLDQNVDATFTAFLRAIAQCSGSELGWRNGRGYMLVHRRTYDAERLTLALEGYVRGPGFTTCLPVHLTGHGDFHLSEIWKVNEPPYFASHDNEKLKTRQKEHTPADEQTILLNSFGTSLDDSQRQLEDEWQQLVPFDPLAMEQTWPYDHELEEASSVVGSNSVSRRASSVSIANSAVMHAAFPDGNNSRTARRNMCQRITTGCNVEPDSQMSGLMGGGCEADVDQQGEDRHKDEVMEGVDNDENEDDCDGGFSDNEGEYNLPTETEMDAERELKLEGQSKKCFDMIERSKEDLEFPDEVDVPVDVSARTRLQKYRGLSSFRTSPWNAYEDLPIDYSRMYSFDEFNATMKQSKLKFQELLSSVKSSGIVPYVGTAGRYCRLVLTGVKGEIISDHPHDTPMILSTLFPYERKVSVMHCTINRITAYDSHNDNDKMHTQGGDAVTEETADCNPLPSKQLCEIHCGFRRFPVRPIFSSISGNQSKNEKHKFLRFLHSNTTSIASFYSPTIFPPSPVLMFRSDGQGSLVGWGSIMSPQTNKMIIKRIVLTGVPFKVHKKKAIVRYMFYKSDDIRWFKPVELHTKKQRRGHIKEPLGTHGYMKCQFNDKVDQSDTVCMYLYKRVYPKWYPPTWGGDEGFGPDERPLDVEKT